MTVRGQHQAYSYISKIEHSCWDGHQPLIVFDGVCVMCSAFVRWVFTRDRKEVFLFTTAQSDLGQSLFAHYGFDTADFETSLVIVEGELHERMDGFIAVCEVLGGIWMVFKTLKIIPTFILDWFYERLKRNRFSWFGKKDLCVLPDQAMEKRIVS